MDAIKFNRIRQIIIDSATYVSRGITFDTQKAYENGYSDEEIANAEYLLTESSYFVKDFEDEIKQITSNTEADFHVYFVEFAKIIFVLHENNQKPTHFFEEDLQKMVLFSQCLGFCDEFLLEKPSV